MRRSIVFALLLGACAASPDGGCNVAPGVMPGFTAPTGAFTSGGNSLNFDLTSGNVPPRLTVTRTGGTFYLQSASTTNVHSASSAALYEDRGDGAGSGLWVFDAYSNDIPTYNVFGNCTNPSGSSGPCGSSGYTAFNGITVTNNSGTAPDGSSTAAKLQGTATAGNNPGFLTHSGPTSTNEPNISSVWVQDSTPTFSNDPGALGPATTTGLGQGTNWFGTGASWRRISALYVKSVGAPDVSHFVIYPAGVAPGTNTLELGATGAILGWGAQETQAEGDVPLVNGSTSAVVAQPNGSLSAVIQNTADVHMTARWLGDPVFVTPYVNDTMYALSFTTADGVSAVYFNNQTVMNGQINGTLASTINMNYFGYGSNVEWQAELFSISSKSAAGIQIWLNGCRLAGPNSARAAYSTMHAPTAMWLGSNQGNAGSYLPRRYTGWNLVEARDIDRGEGVILSDSIIAPYLGKPTACAYIYTTKESHERPGIVSQAYPGYTLAQMLAIWQNTLYSQQRGVASVRWILVQGGINDGIANRTEAQMISDLNAIISDINTNNPNAKILLSPPTPSCGGSGGLTGAVGSTGTQCDNVYKFALDVAGTGANAGSITGSNLIRLPYWDSMDKGVQASSSRNFQLSTACDSGDGVHDNATCRQTVQGATFRSQLQANSLLSVGWYPLWMLKLCAACILFDLLRRRRRSVVYQLVARRPTQANGLL